jgi:ankyrin repeat protein
VNGRKETVLALIDKAADFYARDNSNQTALHFAAGNLDKETVLALIDKGADIDA